MRKPSGTTVVYVGYLVLLFGRRDTACRFASGPEHLGGTRGA